MRADHVKALLAPLAVVALAAGCGSSTRVVMKTRAVHAQPCATAKAMARCVQSVVEEYARLAGFPSGGMRSTCAPQGRRWSCTVLTLDELGQHDCRHAAVLETRLGLPIVLGTPVVYDGSCDRWTA
jgi:hypothetical protein